jgi:hypothetical protein
MAQAFRPLIQLASTALSEQCSLKSEKSLLLPNQIVSTSTTCNSTFQGTIQFVESVVAGQTLQLEGELIEFAKGDSIRDGSALIDPSVNFYIDPITPGLSYTTGSGTSYLSPESVPEPTTLCLLAVGLAGFGFHDAG